MSKLRVITFGVFDYFHFGHLRLFSKCKAYGDYLIVAVQNDDYIKKTKPSCHLLYNVHMRTYILKQIKLIDKVVHYNNVFPDIKKFDFDILVVGQDQTHAGFAQAIKWCKQNGKKVVRLRRTKNISSSEIKQTLIED